VERAERIVFNAWNENWIPAYAGMKKRDKAD
jgi:hypothetical protein